VNAVTDGGTEGSMTDEERLLLTQQLDAKYRWFNTGSRTWSAVHHWSLGLSGIFSTLAVVFLKINWLKAQFLTVENREDFAAIFAAVATLITTLAAAGNFGRKWQTNRVSRGHVERLKIALSDPAADPIVIRNELLDIIKKHDEAIIGTPLK
jgi:hypothetical protein